MSMERRRVSSQLWLANLLLTVAIATGYATQAPPVRSFEMGLFLYLGLIASAATLTLLPGTLVQILARFAPVGVLAWSAAFVWTLAQALVFVDTKIYGIFRYHFNGMVWNVLTTPGAGDAVHVSASDKTIFLVGVAFLFGLEFAGFRALFRADRGRVERAERAPVALRPRPIWLGIVVPCMVIVASTYARADLIRDRHVMGLARVYPVYPRTTVKRFARKYFGYELAERPRVDVATEGILVDYPKEEVAIDPSAPKPNIVLVVIDSLRVDMVTSDVMPNLFAYAQDARTFEDHLSGGNATRFGLFSLLYGLHGSYWKPIYGEQHSPVLIDRLVDTGYSMRVISAVSMDYPEFRSTAWVAIEDAVEDRILPIEVNGRLELRDDSVARRFDAWLDERDQSAPFFAFVLIDAPHQSYAFPPEYAKFEPYAESISYLDEDGSDPDETALLRNRYKNAVHYSDAVVARIIDALDRRGLSDDTVVCVTGDHGEEFFENGFFGHTSNFTLEQVRVPFVMRGPGIEPGVEAGPTSHIDVPPTLLEMVGADPSQRASWSLGGSLFEPDPERRRVSSGWDDLALYTDDAILHVPLSAYQGAEIDVYDYRWRLVDDPDVVLEREGVGIGLLALECRRFLR